MWPSVAIRGPNSFLAWRMRYRIAVVSRFGSKSTAYWKILLLGLIANGK
jgi:hypothetical protein